MPALAPEHEWAWVILFKFILIFLWKITKWPQRLQHQSSYICPVWSLLWAPKPSCNRLEGLLSLPLQKYQFCNQLWNQTLILKKPMCAKDQNQFVISRREQPYQCSKKSTTMRSECLPLANKSNFSNQNSETKKVWCSWPEGEKVTLFYRFKIHSCLNLMKKMAKLSQSSIKCALYWVKECWNKGARVNRDLLGTNRLFSRQRPLMIKSQWLREVNRERYLLAPSWKEESPKTFLHSKRYPALSVRHRSNKRRSAWKCRCRTTRSNLQTLVLSPILWGKNKANQ